METHTHTHTQTKYSLCFRHCGTDCQHYDTIPIPRSTERQLLLFDINDLTKPKGEARLEVSPSTLVPHFDQDTNVLFLAGKGDRSVYAFEFIPGQCARAVALTGTVSSPPSHPCSSPAPLLRHCPISLHLTPTVTLAPPLLVITLLSHHQCTPPLHSTILHCLYV